MDYVGPFIFLAVYGTIYLACPKPSLVGKAATMTAKTIGDDPKWGNNRKTDSSPIPNRCSAENLYNTFASNLITTSFSPISSSFPAPLREESLGRLIYAVRLGEMLFQFELRRENGTHSATLGRKRERGGCIYFSL
ncbi:ABC transporter-like protein [Anopheles sinensis]|uniref:ABC transporter-like protein n=1 Tax=Anopheles sinensis TaxID=74873 RepID=A0A084WS35_ANOSI|nr:ABC transporter-like protein [Anopheles sinensis]